MIVQACLAGDRNAFAELVDRYQGPMYNAAYRITGSVDDAMDATQTAFVRAFEHLHTFDPSHRFFSWLYRITINQAYNVVRRRRPVADLATDIPVAGDDPETAASVSESADHLQRALMELDAQQRTLVLLKHIEGFSYREIGDLLDIPEKTVKSRLFTARRRLRTILLEMGVVR
jgi:RNA polymerase sigma-70 factor (ECF subfamily)